MSSAASTSRNSRSRSGRYTMSSANPNNTDDHSLKELRVALPKMKLAEGQSQPSTSGQALEAASTSAGEGAEKKLVESDGPKGQKKNKSSASGCEVKPKVQKGKMKPAQTETKEKESQKPSKSGGSGEDAKKKPASEEKKNKTEADKTNKQVKEKGNTPKGKAAEKKVNANQEKKNKNQEKKEKTPAGKGQSKEKKTPSKQVEVSHEFKEIKELLRDDPSLPEGWRRIIKGKHVGTELKPVVCIASPEGRKFYFKARLKEYLEKIKSPLTIDDFYFGLYKRNEDKARDKGANAKKTQTQKRKESIGQEHEAKKIRLDSGGGGGGSKKGRASKGDAEDKEKNSESSGEEEYEAGDKNLLLEDPDLPEGWVRKVLIKNDAEGQNKIEVCIISPDGKKFRRRNLLHKHLQKTNSPLDINQFYFGIYPRKDAGETSQAVEQSKESSKPGKSRRHRRRRGKGEAAKTDPRGDEKPEENTGATKKKQISPAATKSEASGDEPMYEDPNLPPGWRRNIKVRSAGESAGRMEVIISSPDGKRHRSRGALEHYIKQKGLNLKADDFDFTVFGKNSKKQSAGSSASSPPKQKAEGASAKKKSSTSHASDSASGNAAAAAGDDDGDDDGGDDDDNIAENVAGNITLRDIEGFTREGAMINYVSALMLNCGLRDLRSERRLRVPKEEQEKTLKNYLDSIADEDPEGDSEKAEIPTSWIKKLAHCRSDFGQLEDDAASAIASLTKDFLINLTQNAYKHSEDQNKLEYNDLAAVIDEEESMAPLRTLIPKKMTFKEYMKLNRPQKFTSFT